MGRKCVVGKSAWCAACLGVLLLATLSGRFAYTQEAAPRDQAEALTRLQVLLKHPGIFNLKLTNGLLTGETKTGTFVIHLAAVSSVTQSSTFHKATSLADYDITTVTVQWFEFPYTTVGPGGASWSTWLDGRPTIKAQQFQSVLIYLVHAAQQEQTARDAADLESFKPKAIAWQQLAVKPAMPEEAQRHEVLAEYAYKNKDLPKAITEYETALKIFPYWPDGQSNLANLAGEVGTRPGYNLAVYHMKLYLLLVPNAPEAKAAQDSIFIWEDKRNSATP